MLVLYGSSVPMSKLAASETKDSLGTLLTGTVQGDWPQSGLGTSLSKPRFCHSGESYLLPSTMAKFICEN